MKLIDKAAVIAEIEKLKAYLQMPNAHLEAIKVCDNVISVIDTLEVKDVEESTDAFIEKACEWLKENFSFDEAGYCETNIYSTKSMIYNFKNTLGGKL